MGLEVLLAIIGLGLKPRGGGGSSSWGSPGPPATPPAISPPPGGGGGSSSWDSVPAPAPVTTKTPYTGVQGGPGDPAVVQYQGGPLVYGVVYSGPMPKGYTTYDEFGVPESYTGEQ